MAVTLPHAVSGTPDVASASRHAAALWLEPTKYAVSHSSNCSWWWQFIAIVAAMAIPLVLNTTRPDQAPANARAGGARVAERTHESRAFEPSDPRPLQLPDDRAVPHGRTARHHADAGDRRCRLARVDALQLHVVPVSRITTRSSSRSRTTTDRSRRCRTASASAATCRPWSSGPTARRTSQAGGTQPVAGDSRRGVGFTVFDIMHSSTIVTSIGVNGLGKITLH